ncbi:MAG: twitch domain-containing radical SAM protein [Chitinophagales bacterium]
MIPEDILQQYNKVRGRTDKTILCHAPFTNMNFEQNGNITACCYNRTHVLGTYPKQSILQAWTGENAEELRQYIFEGSLDGGCEYCKELILSKNFRGAKSLYYDSYAKVPLFTNKIAHLFTSKKEQKLPSVLEFEISNVCNLECEMCNGYYSSSIRKNREHKPPLANPYDDDFIEQVTELMPYVKEMKFLGGEPFLVDSYLKIWERIINVNPEITVHITTNGTVFNNRIKELLLRLNCCITVSLDSLTPSNYERIRTGAKFSRVMDNVQQFIEICRLKGTPFSIAICPMSINWQELPALVKFANERDINTHYNTVWYPEELSIKSLHPKELRRVVDFLVKEKLALGKLTRIEKLNLSKYSDVVQNINHWLNEAVSKAKAVYPIKVDEKTIIDLLPVDSASMKIVLLVLKYQFDIIGSKNYPAIDKLITDELPQFEDYSLTTNIPIDKLMSQFDSLLFAQSYQDALAVLQKIFFPESINVSDFEAKVTEFKKLLQMNSKVAPFIVEKILNGHPLEQIPTIANLSIENLTQVIATSYNK